MQNLPIVAVVGRPNVGKSTLINRITQQNDAIVHEMRGVTRDRSYHTADWNGVNFTLIDTGGIEMSTEDAFQASIRAQALAGARESDVIIFLVDAQTGITQDDEDVARILRKANKPLYLAVNKLDNPANEEALWEFYSLGLGDPHPLSALHGTGTGDLLDLVVESLAQGAAEEPKFTRDPINVAIIGRPNAGKSSLTNQLVKSERSIVSDVAGTTRDSIDTPISHDSKDYIIVDTAGLRRKSQIDEDVEYFSFVRAMRAIDRAQVCLLVVDSTIGLTDQDKRVANFAYERGCGLAIVLNKWDNMSTEDKLELREVVAEEMQFVSYAPLVAISALTGKNVEKIWALVDKVFESYSASISTSKLNTWLSDIREAGHTVTKGKSVLRMKYITQTATCPPKFTLFVNRPDIVTDNFKRFLENRFRKTFPLAGAPVYFKFKKKD